MTDKSKKYLMIFVAVVILGICLSALFPRKADAQTPPVSTITDLPDTVNSLTFSFPVYVDSSIPWDTGGGVGFYWRERGDPGWTYDPELSGYIPDQVTWTAPYDSTHYEFSTQVTDNEGNEEAYHQVKASFYVCTACLPPDDCPPCPTPSVLDAVIVLASQDPPITKWGIADTPGIEYYWTHYADPADSNRGHIAVEYEAEWEVDGAVSIIPGIARGDSLYGRVEVPYTHGQSQRLRVRGIDANGVVGIFSIWSVMFTDDGPPPQPGSVSRRLIMVGP